MTTEAETQLLSQGSVCRLLDCSRMSLYRLRKTAGFPEPAMKIGTSYRWILNDIQRWQHAQRIDAA